MTLTEAMGNFEKLSASEKEAFKELKQRLNAELTTEQKNDDDMFIRFLRARDFKIDQSEDMLRKHLQWRKLNKIDTIETDYVPNEVVIKYMPITRIGFDKDGEIVRYFDFGNADIKGIVKAARTSDVVKSFFTYFEDDIRCMKEQSKKLRKPIQQWTYIMEFGGLTFAKATHKPTIDFLLQLFQVYEANYPERLKRAFVINSTVYFTMLYAIIKPLLSGATVRKITILGKDDWKNELLNHIDPEVLPSFLGGKRTDPDGNPLCNTILMHGKPIPESLYLVRKENRISSQPDAKQIIVSRKSKSLLPIKVEELGAIIEWEFETESRDIGFELLYRDASENPSEKQLIPKQRIDAHLLSEAGMYKCNKPGTYILVFDNTYSWIHRKEIYCKVSVVLPTDQS